MSDFSGLNIVASTPILKISTIKEIITSSIDSYNIDYVLVIQATLRIKREEFIEEIILFMNPKTFDSIFKAIVKKVEL